VLAAREWEFLHRTIREKNLNRQIELMILRERKVALLKRLLLPKDAATLWTPPILFPGRKILQTQITPLVEQSKKIVLRKGSETPSYKQQLSNH
jgi:hypothetical protein